MCIYIWCLNPKYYVWVHIFFMLNVYLILQWLFGRLHPHGVDVQVEDAWSAWVCEDGLMHTLLSMLLFWSLSSNVLIRMLGFYLCFEFMFEEPLSSPRWCIWDVEIIMTYIVLNWYSAGIVYDLCMFSINDEVTP